MKSQAHLNPSCEPRAIRVGGDVARVRNQFLLDSTLKDVTDAVSLVKGLCQHEGDDNDSHEDALFALDDAQKSLRALGAKP